MYPNSSLGGHDEEIVGLLDVADVSWHSIGDASKGIAGLNSGLRNLHHEYGESNSSSGVFRSADCGTCVCVKNVKGRV